MKYIFTFLSCIITLSSNAQQERLNKFYLVNKLTGKPLTVSVAIMRANLSITTENDGIFIIPGDLDQMKDTVIFSAQNYEQLKMALKKLSGLDTLRLTPVLLNKKEILPTLLKDTILNDYKESEIAYYAGLHNQSESFSYLQLAQQFYINKSNTQLAGIQIDRLSFNIDNRYRLNGDGRLRDYRGIEYTKFKVRIYDIDQATGKPGKDLCTEVIEIKLYDSEKAFINLKKYNIVIPHERFFIAVEWMRDYYNANYTRVINFKPDNKKIMSYKPAIGISPLTGKTINIWALDAGSNWILYDVFNPFGTDLAIKAYIAYN